jgi:Na+/H+ antiporter NhaC
MAAFLILIFLVTVLYFVNASSDAKNGVAGKSIKETLLEPNEVGLGNSILMWLIVGVGIVFIFWMLGLN